MLARAVIGRSMDKSNENEVSIEGRLTESGFSGKAISRAISSFDRLVGNIFDIANVHLEGVSERKRAKTSSEVDFIKAVGQSVSLKAAESNDFVERALEQYSRSILRRQENKECVVEEAFAQLSTLGDRVSESENQQDVLDEVFLDRFEMFAEGASTTELRERWGRVLASEIREPGTFSSKVMRVVDELDSDTALLFEDLCRWRLGDQVLRVLVDDLGFSTEVKLLNAGLIVEPASGIKLILKIKEGSEILLWSGDEYAFSFHKNELSRLDGFREEKQFSINENGMSFQVYQLTDAGTALSSILYCDEKEVISSIITSLIDKAGINFLALHRYDADRDGWVQIASYPDSLKVKN